MLAADRWHAADIDPNDIPTAPGVYTWLREGKPIYAGRAVGADGLRDRLWRNHLDQGADLSRSSYRRNVCEHLGIAPTSVTRRRPSEITVEQAASVNAWIRGCQVAWVTFPDGQQAKDFEKQLLAEWKPPLSRR